jgi:hypothetical protein
LLIAHGLHQRVDELAIVALHLDTGEVVEALLVVEQVDGRGAVDSRGLGDFGVLGVQSQADLLEPFELGGGVLG